jgi:hypothetical protein
MGWKLILPLIGNVLISKNHVKATIHTEILNTDPPTPFGTASNETSFLVRNFLGGSIDQGFNVELNRANDGAARAPHETCLRQASDAMIG